MTKKAKAENNQAFRRKKVSEVKGGEKVLSNQKEARGENT